MTKPVTHYDPSSEHTNTSRMFWKLLGDFWNLFEDKDIMENVWGGYLEMADNLYAQLYSQDTNRSFKYDKYGWECRWEKIGPVQNTELLSDTDTRLDPTKKEFNKLLPYKGVLSLPVMYKTVYKYLESDSKFEAKDGRDYIVTKDGILFHKDSDFNGMYWAPTLFRDDDFIFENFGAPFEINMVSCDDYYSKIKGIWYAMWAGPIVSVVVSGINIMLGYPVAEQNGIVTSTQNVNEEYIVKLSYGKEYKSTIPPAVYQGQQVSTFQPIFNIALVKDRITNPAWWRDGIKARKFDSGKKMEQGLQLDSWLKCSAPDMSIVQQFHAFKVTVAAEGLKGIDKQIEHLKMFMMRIKPSHTKFIMEIDLGIEDTYFDNIDMSEDTSISMTYMPVDVFWKDSNFDESLRNSNRVYGWTE